ncbi:MAG: response UmuD protein [Alphaproteobacteria bacterium]|jgi:DNA polymerase V|nr:response UmuD protein [Alphaproteobacteria bacterium]
MPRGGSRPGAGRKVNTGVYGERTVAKRIPVSLVEDVQNFIHGLKGEQDKSKFMAGPHMKKWGSMYASTLNLPLFSNRVQAGFPSPADDHLEESLDLNKHLIQHPAATFFVRASGNSMVNASINNNDILVVDRSLEPKHGDIVIAALNGELTVKRLHAKDKRVALKPENPDYPVIEITEEMEFLIWGVVTSVVHQLKDAHK